MNIKDTLNEVLVKLFREIITIEERSIKQSSFSDLTANDMHVMEAIGTGEAKNMSTVAKSLSVTTGTLTISVNGLVKKGYVDKIPSDTDRREIRLQLSDRFYHYYNISNDYIHRILSQMKERMSEDECAQFIRSLSMMIDIMDECSEPLISGSDL